MIVLLILPVIATPANNDVCAGCHEDEAANFGHTSHGIYFSGRTDLTDKGCEACHGSGDQHVADNDPASIINPARTDQFGATELCLSCHQGANFDDWAFSNHANANLSCASCHTVHGHDQSAAAKTAPDMCYDCHSDVKASFSMPSHHPVTEGKMSCLDCHGIHGQENKMALDDGKRELCFSCHAEKEGPFVYEHMPVNEDCGLCHSPHGSVANNLLTQTEPSLCLNCHAMHFHATVESVDGEFTPPLSPDRTTTATADGFKQVMLTKCTQCHTAIHGTDLPSQALSTGGNALTR
jgi:DmsE family decaheme c-type cytochrome